VRTALAATALAVALLAGGGSASGGGAASGSFAFGTTGGNVVPRHVTISATGRVVERGRPTRTIDVDAVRGLLTLASAEHFFSLPKHIECAGTLPDIAALYVKVRTPARTRTVTVHGGCNRRFAQLFAVLNAVAAG
jgi:hypothetical protein